MRSPQNFVRKISLPTPSGLMPHDVARRCLEAALEPIVLPSGHTITPQALDEIDEYDMSMLKAARFGTAELYVPSKHAKLTTSTGLEFTIEVRTVTEMDDYLLLHTMADSARAAELDCIEACAIAIEDFDANKWPEFSDTAADSERSYVLLHIANKTLNSSDPRMHQLFKQRTAVDAHSFYENFTLAKAAITHKMLFDCWPSNAQKRWEADAERLLGNYLAQVCALGGSATHPTA